VNFSIYFFSFLRHTRHPSQQVAFNMAKLIYFPISGRAEFVKLVFEDKGEKYEFVPYDGDKTKYGDVLPFGQVPVLQIDGMNLAQTGTIVRYLSKKFGYYPQDIKEATRAEMILDGTFDLIQKYFQTIFAKTLSPDEFHKQAITWLGYFDKLLKQHKDGKEWYTSTFSFADLAVFHVTDVCVHYIGAEILSHVPALKSHYERVGARPNIAAFVKSDRRGKVAPKA
jgi:glutathione S-transferase